MTNLFHAELTYYLRGIGFQIHNALRGGHDEIDYENALAYALESDGVPFLRQPVYRIDYRDQQVGEYRPDLVLAEGKVIAELKAVDRIEPVHKAQGISYLAVTKAELALLMNFGNVSMQYERLPNFLHKQQRQSKTLSAPVNGLYPELTKTILDALFIVHRTPGPGFLHQVYRRATLIELAQLGLNFSYLKELPLRYRGQIIAQKEMRLFYIEQKVILATIAVAQLSPGVTEKLRWAMGETDVQLGIVANFYPTQLAFHFMRQEKA